MTTALEQDLEACEILSMEAIAGNCGELRDRLFESRRRAKTRWPAALRVVEALMKGGNGLTPAVIDALRAFEDETT
jgi:hypothetical protein